jgi:hypothetical protein
VEAALQRDDRAPRLGLARELQGRLVGLGAGVGEVHLAAQRGFRQALGELHPRLAVEEVADVQQARGLLLDGRHDGRMAVAERGDGQAGLEVEVLGAVGVPQPCPLPAHELHRLARVGRDDVGALERLELLEAHVSSPGGSSCRCRHR